MESWPLNKGCSIIYEVIYIILTELKDMRPIFIYEFLNLPYLCAGDLAGGCGIFELINISECFCVSDLFYWLNLVLFRLVVRHD